MSLSFGTKGETLQRLKAALKGGVIPELLLFKQSDWQADAEQIINSIVSCFKDGKVIVRSSSSQEDSFSKSNAGAFESIANVEVGHADQIKAAINKVIESYGESTINEQFIVQRQISQIKMSGVMFTRDIDTFAPYYVINSDSRSGSTSSVTSGSSNDLDTFIRYRNSPLEVQDKANASLIALAQELEALFECDHLDIEFAIGANLELFLLQVRPIVKKQSKADENFGNYLFKIFKKIEKLNAPHPGLHGSKAIFSVMTDWNPAEIIGIRPRKLALSLYKELVTDSIWAYQRNNYGYRDLRSFPLLISFLGLPYIDVRASLNSFVPKGLDERLSGKLVDYYIDQLSKSPTDHDKVEFNIVFSCYYLNLSQRLKKLLDCGFSDLELDRIKFALLSLTNSVISPKQGFYRGELGKIAELERRHAEVMQSDISLIDKIYWLSENCKRYGTLPFAGLARAGFIAVQILRSMVEVGIISSAEGQAYMNSLNTVAKGLAQDTTRFRKGELSREEFTKKYGHLRPGTYDILSPRYDAALDLYFNSQNEGDNSEIEYSAVFEFSPKQREQLGYHLEQNGIAIGVDELLAFMIRNGIGKFLKLVMGGLAVCMMIFMLFFIIPMVYMSARSFLHEHGFGGTALSLQQTQERISEITNGCSRGGSSPRGLTRSFWLDWESWIEFDLTEGEVSCLKEKGINDVECACDQRGRRTPPDWFKSEGSTFTIMSVRKYGIISRPCIWHQTGGKYWLAEGESIHCN